MNNGIKFEKRDFEKQNLNDLVADFRGKDFFAEISAKNIDFANIFFDNKKNNFLELLSFYEENKDNIEGKIKDKRLILSVSEMILNFREILFTKNADDIFYKMLNNFIEGRDEFEKDLKNVIGEFKGEGDILEATIYEKNSFENGKAEIANNIHDSLVEGLVGDGVSKMSQLSNSIKFTSENIGNIDDKKYRLKETIKTSLGNIEVSVEEFFYRLDSTSKEGFESMNYGFSYEEGRAVKDAFEKAKNQAENLSDIEDVDFEKLLKEYIRQITGMESVISDVNQAYEGIDNNISEVNYLLEKYSEVIDFKENQIKEEIKLLSIISVIHAINIFASKIDNSIDLSLSKKSLRDSIDILKNTEGVEFDADKLFEEMETLSGLMFVKNLIGENKQIEEGNNISDDLDELMKIKLNADNTLNEMFGNGPKNIQGNEVKKLDNGVIEIKA